MIIISNKYFDMEEIWKEYKTYHTTRWGVNYLTSDIEISNYGNVRGKMWGRKPFTNDIIVIANGRRCIGNSIVNGIYKLVYQLFVGPIPKRYDVHHIDGNPLNDRIDNLVLITHAEHTKIHNTERMKQERYRNNLVNGPKDNTKNMHWFNNGTMNKVAYYCPEGFVPGRLK